MSFYESVQQIDVFDLSRRMLSLDCLYHFSRTVKNFDICVGFLKPKTDGLAENIGEIIKDSDVYVFKRDNINWISVRRRN